MKKVCEIAKDLSIDFDDIIPYGHYIAKINNFKPIKNGKLILISAMTPTTSGEGKTTISIGLCDSLNSLGKKAVLSLREPSLGPVFGMKGGATGGGKASIEPSNEINLHFTGDLHAITSANNLLCAVIDNSIFQGNPLDIDLNNVFFKRCMDMNDRSLREIEIGLEKLKGQTPRKDGFVITAASEIMAILCLAKDIEDLKTRLGNILVALTNDGKPLFAKDFEVVDAMTALLLNAIKPNLVQTLEGNPALVHGGPFANIAHGCSSLIATKTALSLADYAITEAGFGGDLGGEKFFDIVCRFNNIKPSAVVIVATIKALKSHSPTGNITEGFENLKKHIDNFLKVFNQKVIVALNKFASDTEEEVALVKKLCESIGVSCHDCSQFENGGKGCESLAKNIIEICQAEPPTPTYPYDLSEDIQEKIFKLASKIYGASKVTYSQQALDYIEKFKDLTKNLPIVVAKTQYSISGDPILIGNPMNTDFNVESIEVKNGSGFVVVKADKVFLMPGLGKEPNATKIKVQGEQIYNLK